MKAKVKQTAARAAKLADAPKVFKEGPDEENLGVKVKKGHLGKSIKAVLQLVQKKSANANPLLGVDSESMMLYFTLSKVPDRKKMKPFMIPLPNSLYNDKSEICFLCKDPQKQYKEMLMEKHPVPGITKVIGLDKLKRNYKSLEQKRALADSFDLFLCDISVAEMLPKILGSVFYEKKKKPPIPVRLRDANPEENLKKAIGGTPLRIPAGPCLTVKFGRADMEEEGLSKNAATVIAYVVRHLKDNPIASISVKSTDSPALPVWRRARAEGEFLDLKKYHSDASSSAASETGVSGSGTSDSHGTSDHEISDAGETLSTRDTVSEADTLDDYVESLSELDDEAGDVDDDEAPAAMPLKEGLSSKKRKREGKASPKAAPKASPKLSPKASPKSSPKAKAKASMGPPAKKAKKKA